MTTDLQLFNKLNYLKSFIGVYSIDTIPSVKEFPVSLIVNTDPHNKPGEHWLGIYIDKDRKGEFFDSYGCPPLNQELINFLNENCYTWSYNNIMLQGYQSITCGEFCVLFIIMKTIGCEIQDIVHLFTSDFNVNDLIVKSIFKIL